MNIIGSDPFTDHLDHLYFPGWTAVELSLPADWGLEVSKGLACIYLVNRGEAWFHPTNSNIEPTRLSEGDHFVTTRSLPHRLTSTKHLDAKIVTEPIALLTKRTLSANHRAISNAGTLIVCGQADLSLLKKNPLDIGVPSIIHLNNQKEALLDGCADLIDMLHKTQKAARLGWQHTVKRLAEILLVQTLRASLTIAARDVATQSDGTVCYRRAATDAIIGPILYEMREHPERPWTVPLMARNAGVSKSAFSERFRNLVGLPPLQYLTQLQMRRACKMLGETNVEIAEIAILAGYESPSSFSNAFKRWQGGSPVDYRRSQKQSGT